MFEDLTIYRLKINYLENWKVYFLSNVERSRGDIAFAPSDDKGKEWRIVLSWRPLEGAKRKYSSVDEQAKETINQLKKGRQVKSSQIISSKPREVNGHEASFYNLMVRYYKRGGLFKQMLSDCVIRFLLLHCRDSNRCIILYEESDYPVEEERIFEEVIQSFVCH